MIESIAIAKIKPNPFNPRREYDSDSIAELAAEMKEQGKFPTVLLGRSVNGHIELVYGHRRLAAMKLNGIQKVDVDLQDLTDADMKLKAIAENDQRLDLTQLEYADGITALVDEYGGRETRGAQAKVAKLLGRHTGIIAKLCAISRLPQAVKKQVAEGKINAESAAVAHRIGGSAFVNATVSGNLSEKTVKKIASEIGRIKNPEIREKVKQSTRGGHIKSAADVQKKAIKFAKPKDKEQVPDIAHILVGMEVQLAIHAETLEELGKFGYYVRKDTQWSYTEKSVARLNKAMEVIRTAAKPTE